MSSVVERLIESWLDSQTERRYQPAFIQLLVSEGWSVLHNTRHSPIELGKDVIARDPHGVLHCFQLKGNPGGRLTKTEAQGLLLQFIELLELPPAKQFRSSAKEKHVAVFVTNGEIDEEARLLFETAGERAGTGACPAAKFEIWPRGTLLSLFLKTAGRVWPTSVEGTRQVLDLMARDGREIPDPKLISRVLLSTAPTPSKKMGRAAKASSLAALLVVTEVVKAPWYVTDNHYALYLITVIASVQALRFADSAKRIATVTQYANLSLEHCVDLLEEAKRRRYDPDFAWPQRDMFAEADIMSERARLVGDCAATLVLSGADAREYDQDYAAKIIEATVLRIYLWGFAAVPALIVRYWAACRVRAGAYVDHALASHLRQALDVTLERVPEAKPLASPYYGFSDCWAYSNGIRFFADDRVFSDKFRRRAWFARAILFMLAKRNCKQTCKQLWPLFSQALHEDPSLPSDTFFDTLLSRQGKMHTYTFHRKDWTELVSEAVDDREGAFLEQFAALSWLLAAYIAIVPYRAWTDVVMWLDAQLNTTWYSRSHLPVP
jgi:hypothetical protein